MGYVVRGFNNNNYRICGLFDTLEDALAPLDDIEKLDGHLYTTPTGFIRVKRITEEGEKYYYKNVIKLEYSKLVNKIYDNHKFSKEI